MLGQPTHRMPGPINQTQNANYFQANSNSFQPEDNGRERRTESTRFRKTLMAPTILGGQNGPVGTNLTDINSSGTMFGVASNSTMLTGHDSMLIQLEIRPSGELKVYKITNDATQLALQPPSQNLSKPPTINDIQQLCSNQSSINDMQVKLEPVIENGDGDSIKIEPIIKTEPMDTIISIKKEPKLELGMIKTEEHEVEPQYFYY